MNEQEKNNQDKAEQEKTAQQVKQSELASIFEQTDALTPQQLIEKNKKKEKTKIELYGGEKISVKQVKDLIAENKQPYMVHFGYDDNPFYENIYKLCWPDEDHRTFVKRPEVASWTNRLIYGRFDPEVVRHMRKKNPILFTYVRRDKYFQYLTKEGQLMLDQYIVDFNRMIIGYDKWDKFEADYCAKYKIPRQLKLV